MTDTAEQNTSDAHVEEFVLARPHRSEAVREVSSFLASAIVHAVLLVVLALISLSISESAPAMLLNASIDGEEEVDLESLQAELDFTPEELERLATLPSDLLDPGMAAWGEMSIEAPDVQTATVTAARAFELELAGMGGETGQGLAGLGDGKGSASFFGVKASGTKFVFVVDGSKSMNRGKWEACQYELLSAVRRLSHYQRFFVILFARNSCNMFGGKEPERFCVPASAENVRRLERWLRSFELELGTKPHESMVAAMAMQPSAIYLLSDGQFKDATEEFLDKNNRTKEDFTEKIVPRVAVHTIGFFSRDGEELLGRIAKENGGTYKFVPPPQNFKQRGKKAGGGKKPGQGSAKRK